MKRDLTILLIVYSAVLSFACSRAKVDGEKTVRTVKTDTVRVYGVLEKTVFPAKVKAASDVSLAFRIAGPIAKINVDAGRYVRKGQTLAEMDVRDYEIQLSATEAEYKRIKAEADRVAELYNKGSVTPNDYDKATYGLKQITAKYDHHKNALADTRLTAPFDGYVQKVYFHTGETVGAGIPVIAMINAGAPEVEINIPSSEYARRDKFGDFFCTVDVFPGKIFPLDLIGVTPKANLNQLYTMRLKMRSGEKDTPSPGMVAMVTIQYKPAQSELVSIPYSALREDHSASSVWIYNADNHTVAARNVKISEILTDGTVVLSEGLTAGEIIVSAGVHSLKEGETVKLLPKPTSSNAGNLL
ncbi:MAG: efflux RND transporter periplasmic adaptor subunit [Tannerella sp.]|jgi:RND family efflux transporter MFP subunit|nr:efflux RND transporter periplasmic adaptor subunit [Tannerella sp.]